MAGTYALDRKYRLIAPKALREAGVLIATMLPDGVVAVQPKAEFAAMLATAAGGALRYLETSAVELGPCQDFGGRLRLPAAIRAYLEIVPFVEAVWLETGKGWRLMRRDRWELERRRWEPAARTEGFPLPRAIEAAQTVQATSG
jgi:hypothetical protein